MVESIVLALLEMLAHHRIDIFQISDIEHNSGGLRFSYKNRNFLVELKEVV